MMTINEYLLKEKVKEFRRYFWRDMLIPFGLIGLTCYAIETHNYFLGKITSTSVGLSLAFPLRDLLTYTKYIEQYLKNEIMKNKKKTKIELLDIPRYIYKVFISD